MTLCDVYVIHGLSLPGVTTPTAVSQCVAIVKERQYFSRSLF